MQISSTTKRKWVALSTSSTYVVPPAHILSTCTKPRCCEVKIFENSISPISMQQLPRVEASFAIGEIMSTTWIIRACETRTRVCRFVRGVMEYFMVIDVAGYGVICNCCTRFRYSELFYTPPISSSASYKQKQKRKFDAWTAKVSVSWWQPTTQIGSPAKRSWYAANICMYVLACMYLVCMACACIRAQTQAVNRERSASPLKANAMEKKPA